MLTLSHTCNPLEFEADLVNFTNVFNSPDIISHFREEDTTKLFWERSKIQVYPNHYNCSEAYQCTFKAIQENSG